MSNYGNGSRTSNATIIEMTEMDSASKVWGDTLLRCVRTGMPNVVHWAWLDGTDLTD